MLLTNWHNFNNWNTREISDDMLLSSHRLYYTVNCKPSLFRWYCSKSILQSNNYFDNGWCEATTDYQAGSKLLLSMPTHSMTLHYEIHGSVCSNVGLLPHTYIQTEKVKRETQLLIHLCYNILDACSTHEVSKWSEHGKIRCDKWCWKEQKAAFLDKWEFGENVT